MIPRHTLEEYIDKDLISERKHPENENVRIYNYTSECQYGGHWDEITTVCRGLIIDWENNKVLSNPFPKFFNYEEHIAYGKKIPSETPIIFKKYDGWLGILYWLNELPYIATRGSFESEGAVWATKWFRENVNYSNLHKETTFLFEIIAPITRIVCSYDFEGLVQIGSRHIGGDDCNANPLLLKDGSEIRVAERIPVNDYESLKAMDSENEEGFVLRYLDEGLRLKIKFDTYKQLHKIMTNLSAKGIWELMRDGRNPLSGTYLDGVPDEFYGWVKSVVNELDDKYQEIYDIAREAANNAKTYETRKDSALYLQKTKYPGISFMMMDEKDFRQAIWKLIKPKETENHG